MNSLTGSSIRSSPDGVGHDLANRCGGTDDAGASVVPQALRCERSLSQTPHASSRRPQPRLSTEPPANATNHRKAVPAKCERPSAVIPLAPRPQADHAAHRLGPISRSWITHESCRHPRAFRCDRMFYGAPHGARKNPLGVGDSRQPIRAGAVSGGGSTRFKQASPSATAGTTNASSIALWPPPALLRHSKSCGRFLSTR
jgi:hypothetical protein